MVPLFAPLRLHGADFYLPSHAPIRSMPTVLDGSVPMHDHDFIEIVLVLGGTGLHRTIYGDEPVERGDAIVLRPNGWHGYRDAAGLQLRETRFALELLRGDLSWDDPAVEQMLWVAPLNLDRRGLIRARLSDAQLDEAVQVADDLHRATAPERPLGRSEVIGRLQRMVTLLARAFTDQDPAQRKGKPGPHQAVTEGIRLMGSDLRRDWTLPEVARRLGVDRSYLVRLFHAHTGRPPMQFLARMRAEWAAALLLCTSRDIAVVGQQVGWGDPNYFARRFKAEFGMSATKYRERFADAAAV